MACALHIFEQTPQTPLFKYKHILGSIKYTGGTACGNGMYIDFLFPMFMSNTLGASIFGHLDAQSPHPLHLEASTYRGFFNTVTLKLPAFPVTFVTSWYVISSMLGFRNTSTIFGAKMHKLQSLVGKVLSSWAIRPPMDGVFSTRYTLNPNSDRSKDACIPATPPPITRTDPSIKVHPPFHQLDPRVPRILSSQP